MLIRGIKVLPNGIIHCLLRDLWNTISLCRNCICRKSQIYLGEKHIHDEDKPSKGLFDRLKASLEVYAPFDSTPHVEVDIRTCMDMNSLNQLRGICKVRNA